MSAGDPAISDERPGDRSEEPWTLGAIRRMNLQLEAVCQKPSCGCFASFDIDKLIDELGADFELPADGADLACGKCGGPVEFCLGYLHPDPDDPERD